MRIGLIPNIIHVLYKNRDISEANRFIKNLINKLNLEKNDRILDVACGKGRHSIFLNSFRVSSYRNRPF